MKPKKYSDQSFGDDYPENDDVYFKNKKSHKLHPIKKEKSKNLKSSFYDVNDDEDYPDDLLSRKSQK